MSVQGKSKLTRRDFLRLLGLGAGAVAVATVASPAEAAPSLAVNPSFEARKFADPAGRPQRPWWVKTVDKPTIEIDWAKMKRYNEGYKKELGQGTVRGGGFKAYVGDAKNKELGKLSEALLQKGVENNTPGYSLKDHALDASQDAQLEISFLGPQKAKTPEEWGVPKWSGTPEEAARIVRAAFRHNGAATVGFVELDENTRKLVYSFDPDGKELVFSDDAQPSETETQRIIPNSAKYMVVYTIQMSEETLKRAPTVLGSQTTGLAYKRFHQIQNSMQEFFRGLGYMALGEASTNALSIAPAFGVLAGLGELSRLNRLITPEFGPMVRVFTMITDLPVATDKPINAGIMEFCKRCKKCAEACGGAALSFDDEPSWEIRGPWNNAGHKAYFEDSVKCRIYQRSETGTNCGICFAVCPFAKKDKAWIHEWVKAGASTAPALDGFFRSMDDAFGYGAQKDNEAWWSLDLPEYGTDSGGML
ncbi:MAG TPA: reductive dehalogenase [Anaerolineales bacterium]|jgi:reductive dehalogenase